MRSIPHEHQSDIDLSALPGVLKRNARPLMIAAAAVGALTYGGLLLVPSLYTSEAQIRIGRPRLDGVRENAESAEAEAQKVDREAIASRVQELRSPDLARKLAVELHLGQRSEFGGAGDGQGLLGTLLRLTGLAGSASGGSADDRMLAAYFRALQVYQVKDTRVINLGFTARDAELAANVPNRLIALYQDWMQQQGVSASTDTNAWLAPEIEKRTRELSALEAEVDKFRSTANLFRGPGSQPSGLAEQQLADLSSELTKARGQRSEAEARSRGARELIQRGSPDAIPDVQKSPVIQGLIAQRVRAEHDQTEASVQLLPAHPRMKQLSANVADIRRQIQREALTVVEGLEREVKILSLREELASRALEEAKGRIGDKAGDRARLSQLEDEANAKRRELGGLRSRFEAALSRGTTKSVPVEVQVIATARPSSRPSWPNRPQMAALAAAATFVLGLVGVLFKSLLSGNGVRRPAEAIEERIAPKPKLAAMQPIVMPEAAAPIAIKPAAARMDSGPPIAEPLIRGIGSPGANPVVAEPRRATFEHVDDVVSRLIGNSAGHGGYRIVVVGSTRGLDVREEAADIAAGLSAAGRQVVLVDWSLSGTGIATALGLPLRPGFNELATGTASFEDVIQKLPDGDVFVVPSGGALAGGIAALEIDRLNVLLDALDEAYADVIVTGSHDEVRELFLAIEGRFDAGVLVTDADAPHLRTEANSFLGYDVTDIDVLDLLVGRAKATVSRAEPRRHSHLPQSHVSASPN